MVFIEGRQVESVPVIEYISFIGSHAVQTKSFVSDAAGVTGPDSDRVSIGLSLKPVAPHGKKHGK